MRLVSSQPTSDGCPACGARDRVLALPAGGFHCGPCNLVFVGHERPAGHAMDRGRRHLKAVPDQE